MASTTFQKRALETKRREKAEEKDKRRTERKQERDARPPSPAGYDRDLEGIVPGPQPPRED